jgi:hypothetical protein
VEKMGDLIFKRGELDEGKFFLLRMKVVDDLQVDLLKDDVQLVQNLLLHLVENVLAYLHHNCQNNIANQIIHFINTARFNH